MQDTEILSRQRNHDYCRDLLRRFASLTVYSVMLSVLLMVMSAVQFLRIPKQQTYLTTNIGALIPIQGATRPDYRGFPDGE
jgi:hypothetical protein